MKDRRPLRPERKMQEKRMAGISATPTNKKKDIKKGSKAVKADFWKHHEEKQV